MVERHKYLWDEEHGNEHERVLAFSEFTITQEKCRAANSVSWSGSSHKCMQIYQHICGEET